MNHVNIAKLNVCHLYCKHSIQYSKLPIKNLANCIFRANCQIFDLPIIPCIQYIVSLCTCTVTFSYADSPFNPVWG